MTLTIKDLVFETSYTTGTGTYNLAGPVSGFLPFSNAGNGAKVPYIVNDGTNYEIGVGTVTVGSPNLLARTTILASSNSNAAVNWGSGTRNIRLAPLAGMNMTRDESLNFTDLLGIGGGSANAHTITMPITPKAYSDGMIIMYRSPAENDDNEVNVNVDSLGNKRIKVNGNDPEIGQITTGMLIIAAYKSSANIFETINVSSNPDLSSYATISGTENLVNKSINGVTLTDSGPGTGFLSDDGTYKPAGNGRLLSTTYYTCPTQTCTISIASPAVITVGGSRLLPSNGSPVRLTTTGALPTGLAINTTYYVINASGTTFNLSATKGGSAIATTGTQSGTHTITNAPYIKSINNPTEIDIEVVGAGGGGGGSAANTSSTDGTAGGTSSFGSHLSATGGALGNRRTSSSGYTNLSSGGVGSGGDINLPGEDGSFGCPQSASAGTMCKGGDSEYGRGGYKITDGANYGSDAGSGYGAGGSASYFSTSGSATSGAGGGYSRKMIPAGSLGASETITVGAAGAAGGGGGGAGADGTNGIVIVREYS